MGSGDSGCPYWIESKDNKRRARQTIIAIESQGLRWKNTHLPPYIDSTYLKDESMKCRGLGTKVNEEVVHWIMDLTEHYR